MSRVSENIPPVNRREARALAARLMVELLTTFHDSCVFPESARRLDGDELLVAARVMQGHCEGRLMTKAKLVRCLGIPETTVGRKLQQLVAQGIIVRQGDYCLIAPERAAALPDEC
jgi:hypothetical protein